MKAKVVNLGPFITARLFSDRGLTQIGSVPKGAEVEIVEDDGKWAGVRLIVGDKELLRSRTTTPGLFYLASSTLDYGTPHPVREEWKKAKYMLGVSCLNDHAAGMDALARGCRSVLFMDGLLAAIQAAKGYPDAIIFNRSWFPHRPDPVWLADHHGAGLMDVPQNMWSTCANEQDWDLKYDTPRNLRERFEYERTFAQALWAKNPTRRVVIGEFSHGTPDVTNPEIVRAFKETYYAFAEKNVGRVRIGWHLYTKGRRFESHPQEIDGKPENPEWHEGRDYKFWKQCGASRSVVHSCGETGVESVHGSFVHPANYSDQQFKEWCMWWLSYRRSMDVEMNGVCIFQYGNHPNWRGYNVQRYAGLLQEFWQEKIP
jgi:hypothetical protein